MFRPTIQNTQTDSQDGVNYDPSLEHTLTTMKTANIFLKIEESPNGDKFWNGIPVEKLGGSRLQSGEDEYHKNIGFQNVFNDTTEKFLKKNG